jgi:hypothetical protein
MAQDDGIDTTGRPRSPRGRAGSLVLIAVVLLLTVFAISRQDSDPPADSVVTGSGPAVTAPVPAEAETVGGPVLVDVAGAGPSRTKQISPDGDWSVAWAYDCSLAPSAAAARAFVLTVNRLEPPAPVVREDEAARGVERYTGGGPLHLDIATDCPWSVKVYG